MSASTLLVDIGNTRVKWAVADPVSGIVSADVRSSAHDALPVPLSPRKPERIVFSNVASTDLAERLFAPWPGVVLDELKASSEACGVVNGYRHAERLGADRWAALIGAHAFAPDRDLVVCGFGTATTIDLLTCAQCAGGQARFVGGMIFPGAHTMRRALARDTARLPLATGIAPDFAPDFATDTDDAIESGILAAQAGAVERAVRRARSRHDTKDPMILLSGGDAAAVAVALDDAWDIRTVPDLVLRGLAIVARATTAVR